MKKIKNGYLIKVCSVVMCICMLMTALPLSAFGAGKAIDTVKLTGVTIDLKAGSKPKFTAKSAEPDLYGTTIGDGYEQWYDAKTGQYLNSNDFYNGFAQEGELIDKFIEGHKYTYSVAVQAKDPNWENDFACTFKEDTKLSINGKIYDVKAKDIQVIDFFGTNYYIVFNNVMTVTATSDKISASKTKVTLSKTSYTYDGKAKKPTVTVKDSKGKKISSSNYSVSYAKGRTKVGSYDVTVKFSGKYTGKVVKSFKINPKATKIGDVKAKGTSITVKWSKVATETTGYQIQYSTSSSFKSSKTVKITKNSTTSKTINGLKSNKKYYVRVRTYKTVSKTNYYSSWSDVKTATTK